MKCPKCDGTGEMQICEMGFIGKDECDKCHGKGYLTNEEWLRQANTEELAEYITDELNDAIERVLESVWLNDGDTDRDEYYQRKSDVLEWLKEIHE